MAVQKCKFILNADGSLVIQQQVDAQVVATIKLNAADVTTVKNALVAGSAGTTTVEPREDGRRGKPS